MRLEWFINWFLQLLFFHISTKPAISFGFELKNVAAHYWGEDGEPKQATNKKKRMIQRKVTEDTLIPSVYQGLWVADLRQQYRTNVVQWLPCVWLRESKLNPFVIGTKNLLEAIKDHESSKSHLHTISCKLAKESPPFSISPFRGKRKWRGKKPVCLFVCLFIWINISFGIIIFTWGPAVCFVTIKCTQSH